MVDRRSLRLPPAARVGAKILARTWNQFAGIVEDQQRPGYSPRPYLTPYAELVLRTIKFKQFPTGNKDYWEGYDPLDTGETALILVALPYNLRPSLTSHGGSTFTYTNNQSREADGTETQVVVPSYDANDLINVIGPYDTGVATAAGVRVLWFDQSVHHWAAEPA